MAIERLGTLRRVASKKLKGLESQAFTERFAAWVNGTHSGNQTKAGADLGISQSHVSALLLGDRGPGLPLLVALRAKTGFSLDWWLGLSNDKTSAAADVERVLQRVREEFTSAPAALPPPSPDPGSSPAGPTRRKLRD